MDKDVREPSSDGTPGTPGKKYYKIAYCCDTFACTVCAYAAAARKMLHSGTGDSTRNTEDLSHTTSLVRIDDLGVVKDGQTIAKLSEVDFCVRCER